MAEAFAFDADGAQRVVDAVRKVEGTAGSPKPFRQRNTLIPSNLQTVRVTGGSVVGPGGLSYYPGIISQFDRDAGTDSDLASATVWVREPSGDDLRTRKYGHTRQCADQLTISGDTRPLFEVNASGTAGLSVTKTVVVAFDPSTCEVTTEDWTFTDGILTAVV